MLVKQHTLGCWGFFSMLWFECELKNKKLMVQNLVCYPIGPFVEPIIKIVKNPRQS